MMLRAATSADVEALLEVQQPAAVQGLGHIFPQDRYPFPRETIASRWLTEIADSDVDVSLYTSRTSFPPHPVLVQYERHPARSRLTGSSEHDAREVRS